MILLIFVLSDELFVIQIIENMFKFREKDRHTVFINFEYII